MKKKILSVVLSAAMFLTTIPIVRGDSVVAKAESYTYTGNDAVAVAAGDGHTVILKSDGTVVGFGQNHQLQLNVSGWTDITAIAAGSYHTVGLKLDGTVVATGYNNDDQLNVSGWTDITAIVAGRRCTIGLKSDGTVVFVGYYTSAIDIVRNWTDIDTIAIGVGHFAGLKSDGKVISIGYASSDDDLNDTNNWTNITAIAAGSYHNVGLKSDGTVVTVGNDYYNRNETRDIINGWTDITAIATGAQHTVGLKLDGTVVATGKNDKGQLEVNSWTNITAIAAGGSYTIGLKADGTVVLAGGNSLGWLYDSSNPSGVFVKSNGKNVPQPLWYKNFIPLQEGIPWDFEGNFPNSCIHAHSYMLPDCYAGFSDCSGNRYYRYAVAKDSDNRVYGNPVHNKYTLNFTESNVSGVYQLDIKAFYNGPAVGFALDIDFDEEKLEICAPDGKSLTDVQLLGASGYRTPCISDDWADSGLDFSDIAINLGFDTAEEFLSRGISYSEAGWAEVSRFWVDEKTEQYISGTMNNHFASNNVPRTTFTNHIGDFTIAFDTQNGLSGNTVNNRLNPNEIRDRLWGYELMCPENGLSLGTVYFKLRPGVEDSALKPTDFKRDTECANYLQTYGDNSGADIYQCYNDSNARPYAANLETNVLGKKGFEEHSFLNKPADKSQLSLLNRVRMNDQNIQPEPWCRSNVEEIIITKYYKQQDNEIPTAESYGWMEAIDGKIPDDCEPGVYFLMVDTFEGEILKPIYTHTSNGLRTEWERVYYPGTKNLILDYSINQTFKIVEAKTVTAAQLDFDWSYRSRREDQITKQLIVHPQASVSGLGYPFSVVGYRITGTSEWIDAGNPEDWTRPIPYYIAPGVYDLKVSIPEGLEWHGADIVLTGVFTVTRGIFTVTFKDHDGTVLKTDTVSHGNAAVAPPNPSRDGYSFAGWNGTFSNVTRDLTVTAQYISVRMAGDVNGDGSVGVADVVTLRRYLAGWPGVTIDESAADVNGDGAVGAADVIVLRRYLAGWPDVVLI